MVMKTSVSFKEKEKDIWNHLQQQLNPAYYIKLLILEDMKKQSNRQVEVSNQITKQNSMEIDF